MGRTPGRKSKLISWRESTRLSQWIPSLAGMTAASDGRRVGKPAKYESQPSPSRGFMAGSVRRVYHGFPTTEIHHEADNHPPLHDARADADGWPCAIRHCTATCSATTACGNRTSRVGTTCERRSSNPRRREAAAASAHACRAAWCQRAEIAHAAARTATGQRANPDLRARPGDHYAHGGPLLLTRSHQRGFAPSGPGRQGPVAFGAFRAV
jgi:hypothetical protein